MPSSKAIPNSILVLRIFTLLSLVGSGVLLVLDNFTLEDGTETHFYDILSFRYVFRCWIIESDIGDTIKFTMLYMGEGHYSFHQVTDV